MEAHTESAATAARADHAVARLLAETDDEEPLYPRILATIGETLDWDLGALWVRTAEDEALHCAETWCSPAFEGSGFLLLTQATVLQPGEGLPGRVWESGLPAWIADVEADANMPRAEGAAAAGLRSAFCVPLRAPRGVLGAIEFFSAGAREADPELLATLASLGSQVGQFVERRRAERAVRESDERHRASLQAALDCVITIDHRGRVLEFNPAAERTFGYRADEIVGEDMCERIVPPALRPRHREGFSRYLATGDARVLDRRIEITGIRADGSEFPVELAITRIALPGPPAFTAYLRDISERKRAEQELRASRVRIVESADAARRQFERDIHDGAQSRLVNLGLTLHRIKGRARDGDDFAVPMLDEAIDEIREIVGELRELARGIHPQVLSDGGLEPALNGLASRSPTPVHMRIEALPRLPERVEATVYFLVAEALTNVARYAQADSATVAVSRADGMLDVEVSDDGKGGADPGAGTGLRGLADRVAALDGELRVTSDAGEGTTVSARIPCE